MMMRVATLVSSGSRKTGRSRVTYGSRETSGSNPAKFAHTTGTTIRAWRRGIGIVSRD